MDISKLQTVFHNLSSKKITERKAAMQNLLHLLENSEICQAVTTAQDKYITWNTLVDEILKLMRIEVDRLNGDLQKSSNLCGMIGTLFKVVMLKAHLNERIVIKNLHIQVIDMLNEDYLRPSFGSDLSTVFLKYILRKKKYWSMLKGSLLNETLELFLGFQQENPSWLQNILLMNIVHEILKLMNLTTVINYQISEKVAAMSILFMASPDFLNNSAFQESFLSLFHLVQTMILPDNAKVLCELIDKMLPHLLNLWNNKPQDKVKMILIAIFNTLFDMKFKIPMLHLYDWKSIVKQMNALILEYVESFIARQKFSTQKSYLLCQDFTNLSAKVLNQYLHTCHKLSEEASNVLVNKRRKVSTIEDKVLDICTPYDDEVIPWLQILNEFVRLFMYNYQDMLSKLLKKILCILRDSVSVILIKFALECLNQILKYSLSFDEIQSSDIIELFKRFYSSSRISISDYPELLRLLLPFTTDVILTIKNTHLSIDLLLESQRVFDIPFHERDDLIDWLFPPLECNERFWSNTSSQKLTEVLIGLIQYDPQHYQSRKSNWKNTKQLDICNIQRYIESLNESDEKDYSHTNLLHREKYLKMIMTKICIEYEFLIGHSEDASRLLLLLKFYDFLLLFLQKLYDSEMHSSSSNESLLLVKTGLESEIQHACDSCEILLFQEDILTILCKICTMNLQHFDVSLGKLPWKCFEYGIQQLKTSNNQVDERTDEWNNSEICVNLCYYSFDWTSYTTSDNYILLEKSKLPQKARVIWLTFNIVGSWCSSESDNKLRAKLIEELKKISQALTSSDFFFYMLLDSIRLILLWESPRSNYVKDIVHFIQKLCVVSKSNGLMGKDILHLFPTLFSWTKKNGDDTDIKNVKTLLKAFHTQVMSFKYGKVAALQLAKSYAAISWDEVFNINSGFLLDLLMYKSIELQIIVLTSFKGWIQRDIHSLQDAMKLNADTKSVLDIFENFFNSKEMSDYNDILFLSALISTFISSSLHMSVEIFFFYIKVLHVKKFPTNNDIVKKTIASLKTYFGFNGGFEEEIVHSVLMYWIADNLEISAFPVELISSLSISSFWNTYSSSIAIPMLISDKPLNSICQDINTFLINKCSHQLYVHYCLFKMEPSFSNRKLFHAMEMLNHTEIEQRLNKDNSNDLLLYCLSLVPPNPSIVYYQSLLVKLPTGNEGAVLKFLQGIQFSNSTFHEVLIHLCHRYLASPSYYFKCVILFKFVFFSKFLLSKVSSMGSYLKSFITLMSSFYVNVVQDSIVSHLALVSNNLVSGITLMVSYLVEDYQSLLNSFLPNLINILIKLSSYENISKNCINVVAKALNNTTGNVNWFVKCRENFPKSMRFQKLNSRLNALKNEFMDMEINAKLVQLVDCNEWNDNTLCALENILMNDRMSLDIFNISKAVMQILEKLQTGKLEITPTLGALLSLVDLDNFHHWRNQEVAMQLESSNTTRMQFYHMLVTCLHSFLYSMNAKLFMNSDSILSLLYHGTKGQMFLTWCRNTKKDKLLEDLYPYTCRRQSPRVKKCVDQPILILNNSELWIPNGMDFDSWITSLTTTILSCIITQDLVFETLISLCRMEVSVCKLVIPYSVYFLLECIPDSKLILSGQIKKSMKYFMINNTDKNFKMSVINILSYLNLRARKEEKNTQWDSKFWLDIDYRDLSFLSHSCDLYHLAIQSAEIWCYDKFNQLNEVISSDLIHNGSVWECVYENFSKEMNELETILLESFSSMNEKDSIYGCSAVFKENDSCRLYVMEMERSWLQIIAYYDQKLFSYSNDFYQKLLKTYMSCHLYNTADTFIKQFSGSGKPQWIEDAEYECAWRLQKWDVPMSRVPSTCSFHKSVFKFLNSLRTNETEMLNHWLEVGQRSICSTLCQVGLENKASISQCFIHLQALTELCKLKDIVQQPVLHDHFGMIKAGYSNELSLNIKSTALQILSSQYDSQDLLVFSSELLLKKCQAECKELLWHSAQHTISLLKELVVHHTDEVHLKLQVSLQEALTLHSTGEENFSKRILKTIIGEWHPSFNEHKELRCVLSNAVSMLTDWSLYDKSEIPKDLLTKYLEPALTALKDFPMELLLVNDSIAKLADECHDQILDYVNSDTFQNKLRCMKDSQKQTSEVKNIKSLNRDQQVYQKTVQTHDKLDQDELDTVYKGRENYLIMAIKHHIKCLHYSNEHDVKIFRILSLWFSNPHNNQINSTITDAVKTLQSYKWIPVIPQVTARLGTKHRSTTDTGSPITQKLLIKIIETCGVEHPFHILPHLTSLYLAYEDDDIIEATHRSKEKERVMAAKQILETLRKFKKLSEITKQMVLYFKTCIRFANVSDKTMKNSRAKLSIPRDFISLCSNTFSSLPIATYPIFINRQGNYEDIPLIVSYEKMYETVGGINQPKKLTVLTSKGNTHFELLKGQDDLRQDAVMQQVFGTLNDIFKSSAKSSNKFLTLRTYKVVPLSQRSGLIEWCKNTQPLGEYLAANNGAHIRYRPQDWTPLNCRKKLEAARGNDIKKYETYLEICKNLQPVFHHFFFENFLEPNEWFHKRQCYCRSMATNSMIGYILGIGDRHVQNILIDKITAEVIHIDFGLAFEQAQVLQTPETVPFRLTRDLVDGMGVFGVEGIFRRCCESTITVLRKNTATICTLLEVLLYDPLYLWTVKSDSQDSPDGQEINKLATRVLLKVREKLQGIEHGTSLSSTSQVKWLIQTARDPHNLSRLYHGWQPYL